MRLQLLIQRHTLPPVTIIHTTGTGPTSHTKSRSATVADLLSDVNDLVPLESSDGEWGLEDYVVEVAATGDQELTYECLHFQVLQSVLRDDDEVLIRALSNDDLRVRRLGGRHQITGDGRHLIDGIPFGKRWLRQTTRPGMVIPPRKRRRLLPEEDSVLETEEDLKRILPAGAEDHYDNVTGALVPFTGDDDDEEEEDDDDYVDEDEDDAQDHIIVGEEFDDADADQDEEPELDGELEAGNLTSEVKQLLKDAAEIEQTSNLAIASLVLENHLKRKRPVEDDGGHEQEDMTFEGFSTAVNGSSLPVIGFGSGLTNGVSNAESDVDDSADSLLDEITAQQEEKRMKNIVQDDDDDSDDSVVTNDVSDEESDEDDGPDSLLDEVTAHQERKRANNIVEDDNDNPSDSDATSMSDTSSSDSNAESLASKTKIQQARQRALNLIRSSGNGIDEDETSSSGSDTDDDDEVSNTASDSGSESESESDDSSESESVTSSESALESDAEKVAQPTTGQKNAMQLENIASKVSVGIPFEGKTRTHQNNERTKRKKRLNSLKKQGLLPQEADFRALAEYEKGTERNGDGVRMQDHQGAVSDQQDDKKVMDDVLVSNGDAKATVDEPMTEGDKENVKPQDDGEGNEDKPPSETASVVPEIPETSQTDSQSIVEPAPKRARLDLASSRRLIFGSLGVRTPKNAEQEQKLREKLSQNVRQLKQSKEEYALATSQTSPPTAAVIDEDEFWKNKLIVSAVECEEPGGVLPPPPFPFQQGWAKSNKNKRKMRGQSQYYQGRDAWAREEDEQATAPDFPILNYDNELSQTNAIDAPSKVNEKADDLPSEQEIEKLPSLEPAEIRPGATIAYQELHIDAATNYEPSVSPFRVGKVSQMDEDGIVHLQLAQSLFDSQAKARFDGETGERIYGKFEIADEDADEEDDGLRHISFSGMIKPKLVKPSSIQVPDSSHAASLRGGEAPIPSTADDVAMVPESAEQDAESLETGNPEITMSTIDTPRKQEINGIIKEAGFESALDEQLLQPIVKPVSDDMDDTITQDDFLDESQGEYAHRFRRRSPRGIVTSSDPQPSSAIKEPSYDDDFADAGPIEEASIPATSSPYMPTLNTVDYPHISQMEINSSAPIRTTNSSSHQDAQKLSPPPVLDLSFTVSEPEKPAREEADLVDDHNFTEGTQTKPSTSSLHPESPILEPLGPSSPVEDPEIERTQFPQVTSDVVPSSPIPSPDYQGSSAPPDSFLGGPGYDGNDSSYHDSFDDNSSLPSLSDIISSQPTSRRTSRRTSKRTSTRLTEKASSPASALIKTPVRTSNASRRKKKSPTPQDSPELASSSQMEFKASQSQRSQPRLSQIPAGSQVVDLTCSSDQLSPIKNPVKDRYEDEDDDSDYIVSTKKNKNKIEVKSTSRKAAGRGTSKQTSQDSGIGKRTLLTKKRASDNKYY